MRDRILEDVFKKKSTVALYFGGAWAEKRDHGKAGHHVSHREECAEL